jgi:Holliday junction DNA helicase RuvB
MNGEIQLITGSDTGHINPVFDNVIGQEAALAKLRFFLTTHDSVTPVPTFLFTGSHGLGKTYVAEKLANAMGRRFVEENCGIMTTEKEFIEGVLMKRVIGDTPCTLFLDESHRLSSEITTILLTLLNPSSDMRNEVHYKNWKIVFDMSKINVIFATTDAYRMFGPLVNRTERIYFDSYDRTELIDMVHLYCPQVGLGCDTNDLAEACRGRGRDAFQLSQKINRYVKHSDASALNGEGWDQLKQIFEIQPMGLNRQEVELLKIVANHGAISVANIALAMMVNADNIESELEIRPRELGLLKSTSRGRSLTEKGLTYIESL